MSGRNPADVRLEVARGHWLLGEVDDALRALERGLANAPEHAGLRAMLDELEGDARDPTLAARLRSLRELWAPEPAPQEAPADDEEADALLLTDDMIAPEGEELPATSTVAELLAAQGHVEQALRVAEEVLRRDPNDARARAVRARLASSRNGRLRRIATLERWLSRLERRPGPAGTEVRR